MAIINMIGGGAGVNLSVKAYATEAEMLASAPKNNTVGVVTGSMTDWAMGFDAPETAANGLVFIRLGTDSKVKMSASANKTVTVCPLYARIRNGESWNDVDMMVYQGGAWLRPWEVFVQNKQKVANVSLLRCSFDENGLNMSTSASASTSRVANIVADVTNYNRIVVKYNTNANKTYSALSFRAGVARVGDETTTAFVKSEDLKPDANGTYEATIDISGYVGEMVVKIFVTVNQQARNIYIHDWRLEP